MKTALTVFLVGLAAWALSLAAAEDTPVIKKEMAQLQGEWTMLSGSADGYPVPASMLANSKRICKENETTSIVGGQLLFKARFTLDPSKKPKAIDYQMTEGFTKGKQQLGIYEFDGDTVKFSFGGVGAERPADFASKPGDGRTVSVWKRAKAPEPSQK